MGAIEATDTGSRPRVLAELMGAQVAWWQLGFAARRAVLRAARRGSRFPEPEIWDVAVGWAWQLLAAPRWWRTIRGAGATTASVLVVAGMANVLAEVDLLSAVSGAATVCPPLAAGWTWRQVRNARAIVRLVPLSRLTPVSRRRTLLVRAAALVVAVGCAADALIYAIALDRAATYACAPFAVDASVHRWWVGHGGRQGVGCPTGGTRANSAGVRYTPWARWASSGTMDADSVVYDASSVDPMIMPTAVFAAWTGAGGPAGALGEPVDNWWDGATSYVMFRGGTIELRVGADPKIHFGRWIFGMPNGRGGCVPRDRPCITAAFSDAAGLHLAWQYGSADAFNVAWRPEGDPEGPVAEHEVAGYQFSWPDPHLAGSYIAWVQACDKHFLSRSSCTPRSARVIIRVR